MEANHNHRRKMVQAEYRKRTGRMAACVICGSEFWAKRVGTHGLALTCSQNCAYALRSLSRRKKRGVASKRERPRVNVAELSEQLRARGRKVTLEAIRAITRPESVRPNHVPSMKEILETPAGTRKMDRLLERALTQ